MTHSIDALKALDAYDKFMRGSDLTDDENTLVTRITKAAIYASAAYAEGMCEGSSTHAMLRSFLCAMIDPLHPDLDYLRTVPASGADMRGRN